MTIPLKGGKELSAFLQAFPDRIQRNAVNAGLRASAKVVRDQARANAPKKSGKYAKSIKTGSPRKNDDGTISITIRPKGEHSYLGLWLEYGVGAHFLTGGDSGKSARLLTRQMNRDGVSSDVETRAMKIGNNWVSGAILHPGFAPKPHFRPALDTQAENAIKAFADRIESYLKDKTGFTAPSFGVDDE